MIEILPHIIYMFFDIEQKYKKIISSEKLVRVTKSFIGKRTGYGSLLYRLLINYLKQANY